MRTVLVTGASRGLGYATARAMLRESPGTHVVIAVRGRATGIADRLAADSGNANVSDVECDLASQKSVRAAAAEIAGLLDSGALPPLRGIVGNAGVQTTAATQRTPDGLEMTFGTNVIGHYLLVRLVLERLAAPARIVLVGSGTHFGDFQHSWGLVPAPRNTSLEALSRPWVTSDAATPRAGRAAYAASKLAIVHLVHELARRLPAGVDAYTFDPGLMPGTGLVRDGNLAERLMWNSIAHVARLHPAATNPDTAGRALARVVTGPKPADSGAYLERGRAVRSSPASYDPEREAALWEFAAVLVGLDDAGQLSG